MDAGDSEDRTDCVRSAGDDLDRMRGRALFYGRENAVVDLDLAGVIIALNPPAEQLFEARARDVLGRPMGVLLPEQGVEEITALLACPSDQQHVEPYATRYRRSDGKVLDLLVTAVPLVNIDGSLAGFSSIFQDLSKLHQAQVALAASEARFRAMIESSHEGIAVLDLEQRLTFVNARIAQMTGYTVEELTGMSLGVLTFPEDEREIVERLTRRRHGKPGDDEGRWRRKDGSTLWTISTTTPLFDEAGALTGSVSFHTDVTDRRCSEAALRASEARLRSYFEYAPVGIVLVNRDSLVTTVNPNLCAITGYGSDELNGNGLSVLLGADYLARIEELRGAALALLGEQTPSFKFEQPFVTKVGRSILLEVTVSLMRNDQGEPLDLVAVIQDITSRKDMERTKDEFISVTSHELRTPLTSIRGALGLLAGGVVGGLPDSAQRMVDIAIQSTDRLIRLINEILDLERISSGKLTMSPEACDAAGLISRAVEEIRGAADALEVEVRATSLDGRVWADPDRIIQTLTNLIGNAIKFSSRSGTVEVSAKVEGDNVRFAIEDHGQGIPADQLEAVFERFQQVDSSDSRAKDGSGLGLAICRTIVEQHGGRIWAESVLGAGTILSFTLPAFADIDEENLDDRRPDPGVLVCDDDPAIRDVVKAMLEASGYRVWTAASGEEALAIARARQPDVIVLDLVLPGIDGRETANALKSQEETADIPVIVLSVLTGEQTAVEGAASLVEKPIEEDKLLTALRYALGGDHRQALVVEDDPQLAEVLEVTLARHGLKVHHARTGREAMRLGRALSPDLLVLDLGLPGGDGYSVVEWMREQHWLSTVPVLVYTAFDLEEADRDRLRLGETKFLTKSRTPPALFEATLEELLDWIAKESPRK